MDIKKYLDNTYSCTCGKTHTSTTRQILIERNAIKKIPALMDELALPRHVFVVCDENTYEAAGKEVISVLYDAGINADYFMFKNGELVHPDEKAIGSVMMAAEPMPDMLIAVGSGTINDLTRFCATRMKIPYFVVATAPSMDGFASGVTPITKGGMKISYSGITPQMVIGDLDILSEAPLKLAAAGYGDIIGKVTAGMDWLMGNIGFGEAMCTEIGGLTNSAVKKCIELSDEIKARTYESTEGLMEALTLSGIAMQLHGNSRPASGAEHHMAHFLEMRDGHSVREGAYHGALVGITTLIIMRLYEKLYEDAPPPQGVVPENMETVAKAKAAYGKVWDAVLENKGDIYLDADAWKDTKARIIKHWDEMKENVEKFKSFRKGFVKTLKECGAPSHPKDLGYKKEAIFDALMYARMLRTRPTILEVLANWGYLEKYATEIIDELYQ